MLFARNDTTVSRKRDGPQPHRGVPDTAREPGDEGRADRGLGVAGRHLRRQEARHDRRSRTVEEGDELEVSHSSYPVKLTVFNFSHKL